MISPGHCMSSLPCMTCTSVHPLSYLVDAVWSQCMCAACTASSGLSGCETPHHSSCSWLLNEAGCKCCRFASVRYSPEMYALSISDINRLVSIHQMACVDASPALTWPCALEQVNALLTGFTATKQPFALHAENPSSNVYAGQLNMNYQFPNLEYSTTATINFCSSNQANIKKACSVGINNGLSFANSTVLLDACTQFLTNGALTSVSQAAEQIALACAVVAVEVGLLCTTGSTNCQDVAKQTFTIQ